jgi:tRNA (adenine57-N1/adenine58-N1)-methyltransferase
MDEVRENDYVLLYLDEKRKYLIKLERNKKLHTHKGFIVLDEIIGKKFGEKIKSNIGEEFVICKPTIRDFILKFARKTQIIYPKDAGYIAFIGGISDGSRVVEIGTGSGALTCSLANLVKPSGHVYSYEIREEFYEIAKKNIEMLNLSEYVTLKLKNALEGIDEKDVDCVVMDIPNPWDAIGVAKQALKGSGILISFSPTINQVEKILRALIENKFIDIHVVELIEREFQADPIKLRPKTTIIGHTGYITWARKSI